MRAAASLPLVLLVTVLAIGGCGDPAVPLWSEVVAGPLQGKQSPIQNTESTKYHIALNDYMIAKGVKNAAKEIPAEVLADGTSKRTVRVTYWNAVKLDGSSIPPEHVGKVAHLVYDQITITKTVRGTAQRTYRDEYTYEIPAK